jgi:hypothetical protein
VGNGILSIEECLSFMHSLYIFQKINKIYPEIYNGFTSSKKLGDYLSVYKENKGDVNSEFKLLSSSLSKIMKKFMH